MSMRRQRRAPEPSNPTEACARSIARHATRIDEPGRLMVAWHLCNRLHPGALVLLAWAHVETVKLRHRGMRSPTTMFCAVDRPFACTCIHEERKKAVTSGVQDLTQAVVELDDRGTYLD